MTTSCVHSICNKVYKQFADTGKHHSFQDFTDAEEKILSTCRKLLAEQTPQSSKLTEGEKIVLAIRERIFKHMDGNIRISSLSTQYQVSEQTLQNSFKSLFGFTPNKFLRLLKLNLVHQELLTTPSKKTTVSKIAYKWGFKHMGQFSAYYNDLFREKPSETLISESFIEEKIKDECTLRQEEL